MTVKLGRKLNLVIPVDLDDDGKVAYVHSMPLSEAAFEAHFMLIARTFHAIYNQGLNFITGPRVSVLILRQQAKETSRTGDDAEAEALLMEIRRLSNVVHPTPQGWETIPYQEAVRKKVFDEETLRGVESEIVFFIVNSAIHTKKMLEGILEAMSGLWGTETTFSTVTEYAASLPTLTPADDTSKPAPAKAAQSVPY